MSAPAWGAALALAGMLVLGELGCGKYGPPVRVEPAAPAKAGDPASESDEGEPAGSQP